MGIDLTPGDGLATDNKKALADHRQGFDVFDVRVVGSTRFELVTPAV